MKTFPEDELLPEYQFDYQKARPNRFIKKSESLITITQPTTTKAVLTNFPKLG